MLLNDMLLLVEPLIPALRRYARSLIQDRATADDLVQDCLERAISRWHQRRADGDARTWLFTILHNLAMSHLRQTARRGRHESLDAIDESAVSLAPAQDDALRHRDLIVALQALPDDQRSVLLLIAVEDLSYAQAASVLAIPVGTVMSRLSRGREKLLTMMETGAATPLEKPFLRRVK
jgi:RNA polymerase sigma factor (sigma-70 family)